MQDADANLKPPQARSHNAVIVRNVADTVLEFVEALHNNTLHDSNLPQFVPSSSDDIADDVAVVTTSTAAQADDAPVATNAAAAEHVPVNTNAAVAERDQSHEESMLDAQSSQQQAVVAPQLSPYEQHSYEPAALT